MVFNSYLILVIISIDIFVIVFNKHFEKFLDIAFDMSSLFFFCHKPFVYIQEKIMYRS